MRLRTFARLTYVFTRQAVPRHPAAFRDFPAWVRSQGRTAFDQGQPWLVYGASRELARHVYPGVRVLEFGAGGSTVYFAQRGASVVSVEHDPEWGERVRAALPSVDVRVVPPEPGADPLYVSTDDRYVDMSFRAYASAADDIDDVDILLIDGRARPATFRHGIRHVRHGGIVVVDDTERPAYAEIQTTGRAAGWREQRFWGPNPGVEMFGETTIWTVR